jgi:hypothetical protein
VEGLGGEVEGGWRVHGVKKACDGAKREEGVPLHPFSGRRHVREERDGGPVGARPRGGGGGLATMRARAGGPGHERCAVGRWQPEDGGAGSHAGEAREEREGRESGGADEWVGPKGGAQLQREREDGREKERPTGGTDSGWDPLAGRGR